MSLKIEIYDTTLENVFVPFLGDFLSMRACEAPARLLSKAHSRRG